MPAAVANPLIEQGAAFALGIETDLDYTGLLGRAWLRHRLQGNVVKTPTVTIPTAMGERIDVTMTPAQTLALPVYGKAFSELESFDFLVELYDPFDATRVYRMVQGVARVSPRGRIP
jgi:hypothetical protein